MKLGTLDLGSMPLFLAPMEDVTYKSFRHMCKKYGADVMYTEFISSDALARNDLRIARKMTLFEFDRPVGIQIYGHDEALMVKAAKLAEESEPDFIDINFGCPVRKIVRRGAGAAMLLDLPRMQRLTEAVVNSVSLPVTAKTRLGWSEQSKPIVEAALRLQDAGIAALAIHGRTREQIYSGKADWQLIGEVKNHPAIQIPIIGNGDLYHPEVAARRIKETGVDGIMIGRPAIGRPWIFREIKHYFETGELLPPPLVPEIIENVREQLSLSIGWKESEYSGIRQMRRHMARYFPGLDGFKPLRTALLQATDYDGLSKILDQISLHYQEIRVDYAANLIGFEEDGEA